MKQNSKSAGCAVVKVSHLEEVGEGEGPSEDLEGWEPPGHWQGPTDQVTNPSQAEVLTPRNLGNGTKV